MLRFEIVRDKKNHKLLKLVHHDTNFELNALKEFFKKPIKGARHTPRFKSDKWDGKTRFFDSTKMTMSFGFWIEVYEFANTHKYDCQITDIEKHINSKLDREKLLTFMTFTLDGVLVKNGDTGETEQLVPRDIQTEAVY